MESEFLDVASKAKELKITEGTLRARMLSGKQSCFVFLANARAYADEGQWLPAWTEENFPLVNWVDHGSTFRENFDDPRNMRWRPTRTPSYHVSGWCGLDLGEVEAILTRRESELNGARVYPCDDKGEPACCLIVLAEPKREWITASEIYEDGGYWRDEPIMLTAADLFIPASASQVNRKLSPRKEQSYLGIIAAMRALLRDKDGGGFPSEAKIIEQLVTRFGEIDGVSKRNLESVFADATRAAQEYSGLPK